jgi:hypothetical protein
MSPDRARLDLSIARWTRDVAARQWRRDDDALEAGGSALPAPLAEQRSLAEVHRLDLSLFVVFEEAALRVSGALVRRAPHPAALAFAAQQTLDEARHHEIFARRLAASSAAWGRPVAPDEILIPPLRKFLDLCYEVADRGRFVEGLVLTNLVLEGMAYPLYAYEERYWSPVDPYLARLIASAFTDETRHVAFGAALVRDALAADPAARASVQRLTLDARRVMNEVFAYYVRKFVGLFDAVARRHRALFAGALFQPGRPLADTPYEEQIAGIRHSIETEHARLLARAGLSS